MELHQAYAAQAQVASGIGFIEQNRIAPVAPDYLDLLALRPGEVRRIREPQPAEHPMRHTWQD